MKVFLTSILLLASFFVASCGSSTVPLAELSEPEQSLLSEVNCYRASLGKSELKPFADLTDFAREGAGRRAVSDGGYVDLRQRTGYESMLTLSGRVEEGPDFGKRLMEIWRKNPVQRMWLEGNHSGVGVGSARDGAGIQTGVVLLGGFAGGSI